MRSRRDAFLFDSRGGMQFNPANDRGFIADKPFFGKNPTYGAAISYYLSKPQTNVALRIRDAAGTQVREITGNDLREARGAGINRIYWDLRHQPLAPLAGQPTGGGGGGGGGGFGGGGNNGPNVMPGEYRVTLVVDGKEIGTKTLRVSGDKDMPMTDAERKTWHDTALGLHEMQRVANSAAEAVTTLATQLTAAEALIKARGERAGGGQDGGHRREYQARRSASPAGTQPAGRWRWRRWRLRRPARQRSRPARPGEGAGHGIDLDAYAAADSPGRRVARGYDEGDRGHERAHRRDSRLLYDALGASGAKPTALKPVGPLPPVR